MIRKGPRSICLQGVARHLRLPPGTGKIEKKKYNFSSRAVWKDRPKTVIAQYAKEVATLW